MAVPDRGYVTIIAESFEPKSTANRHGKLHMRPAPNELFAQDLVIECSKALVTDHVVGTRFRMRVKLTNRQGGGEFLYSYHGWPVDVIGLPKD